MNKFYGLIAGLLLLAAPFSAYAFAFTPPTGFSALTGTWNPADKQGNVTLSNGNLTATEGSGTNWDGVRGTVSVTSGKWYWEVTLNTIAGNGQRVGFMTTGAFSNPFDNGSNGWACGADGRGDCVTNGSITFIGSHNFANGDIVMMAYDAGAGKLWEGINGTWFNSGNPSAGTAPMWTITGGTQIFAAWAGEVNTNQATATFSNAIVAPILNAIVTFFGDWF